MLANISPISFRWMTKNHSPHAWTIGPWRIWVGGWTCVCIRVPMQFWAIPTNRSCMEGFLKSSGVPPNHPVVMDDHDLVLKQHETTMVIWGSPISWNPHGDAIGWGELPSRSRGVGSSAQRHRIVPWVGFRGAADLGPMEEWNPATVRWSILLEALGQ